MTGRGATHRRRLQAVLAVAIAALVSGAIPAALADEQVVAPSGAAASGYSNPKVTITQGAHLTFRNDDTNVPHNVVAKMNGSDGKPLFQSDTVNGPKTVPVNGVESLQPGNYDFYCTVHPYTMTGTLTVTAGGSSSSGGGSSGTTGSSGSSSNPTSGSGKTGTTKKKKHKKHKHKRHHKRRH